jgi:hypothetical protein
VGGYRAGEGVPSGAGGGAGVRVLRWLGGRLLDGAALLVAGCWWVRRELAEAWRELPEGMAACDLDTGRLPWGDGP